MSFELIIGIVGVALFLWWLVQPPRRLKKYGDKIPGPPTAPLFGNALNFNLIGPKAFSDLLEGRKKYGTTYKVWLGPQLHIVVTDADDIQMLLTSQSLLTKSKIYGQMGDWLGTGLLLSTGEFWHRRRKAITPTFHFKILDDFMPVFNKCAETLVSCLKDKAGKGPFDITTYLSNCALDAVAESAMGLSVEAQLKPKSDYVSSIVTMTKLLGEKMVMPWLAIDLVNTITGRKKEEKKNLEVLHSLTRKVLKEKQSLFNKESANEEICDEFGMKKRYAFLERLLNMKNQNNIAFQTDQDVMDEVTTFMFEGHDTTTACLTFTIWLLGKHPGIQETLYKEVSSRIGGLNEMRMEDIQEMKYLERVIKESLRLYPSVPVYGRSLEEDVTLPSGYTLPAGSDVYIGAMIIHRDPKYFPDPETFYPDRFLQEQTHPFAYIPFSAGPRNCIGQKFAMLDMKTIIAKVVYNYRIFSEEEIILSNELILRSLNGPQVRLVERPK